MSPQISRLPPALTHGMRFRVPSGLTRQLQLFSPNQEAYLQPPPPAAGRSRSPPAAVTVTFSIPRWFQRSHFSQLPVTAQNKPAWCDRRHSWDRALGSPSRGSAGSSRWTAPALWALPFRGVSCSQFDHLRGRRALHLMHLCWKTPCL